MKKAREKKLVYVPEDVIDMIAEISRGKGETISKFVEDALRQAVRIDRAGYDVKKSADFFEVMQASKVLGGVFVPLEVLNYLVKKACGTGDKKGLNAKWRESGQWHGKYLKEKFDEPVYAFKLFLEACRWDLNEVEVKKGGDHFRLICVSSVLSLDETELLAAFAEGAISGMGFEMKSKDVVKGMIVLEFKPISSGGGSA
ncbi:MAG: hypothetical protein QW717_07230 [Candidatus Bathyarchaeia archaeon]